MPDDEEFDYLDMLVGENKLTEEQAEEIRNPPFKKCEFCGATRPDLCACNEDRT